MPSRNSNGRWRVRFRRRGHQINRTFRTKEAAERFEREIQDRLDRGLPPLPPTDRGRRRRPTTVLEVLQAFRIKVLIRRKTAAQRRKEERMAELWADRIGHIHLSDLTPDDVDDVREALERGETPSGRPVGPATVNRYFGLLRQALNLAVRRSWIDRNPCDGLELRQEPRGRDRWLRPDEQAALLEALSEDQDRRLFPLALLALTSGARESEIMGICWPDIDWDRQIILLRDTKNREDRTIALTSNVLEELRELSRIRRIDTDRVFAGPRGGTRFPHKNWNRAVRRSGIEPIRFHDLRHTSATYAALAGASNRQLAAHLGHKTLSMVSRYSHLAGEHLVELAEKSAREAGLDAAARKVRKTGPNSSRLP